MTTEPLLVFLWPSWPFPSEDERPLLPQTLPQTRKLFYDKAILCGYGRALCRDPKCQTKYRPIIDDLFATLCVRLTSFCSRSSIFRSPMSVSRCRPRHDTTRQDARRPPRSRQLQQQPTANILRKMEKLHPSHLAWSGRNGRGKLRYAELA